MTFPAPRLAVHLRRASALALFALPLVACDLPGGNGGDAGPVVISTAIVGKWGMLGADGTPSAESGYFFASDLSWGGFSNSGCQMGDGYAVIGSILELRTGSMLKDWDAEIYTSNDVTALQLRVPGTTVDSGASTEPQQIFGQLDASDHTCSSL